jgi:hypothetical protein
MYRTRFDPFCSGWDFVRGFMDCAGWGGRRFYTRQERIDQLERLKKRMQQEISGIEERIQELRREQAR